MKTGTNLDGIFGKVAAPAPGEAQEAVASICEAGTTQMDLWKVAAPGSVEVLETVASMCENWN